MPPFPPLGPPRARWGQFWDPATGQTVWQCLGPSCATRTTSLGLGCAGGCQCGGKCGGAHGVGAYYAERQNLPIGALGEVCPPCYFPVHGQCVACPHGSTLAECEGCVGTRPEPTAVPWYERPLAGPVIVGLVSAVALGIAVPIIRRQLGKAGVRVE